jgi:hypothetical protein
MVAHSERTFAQRGWAVDLPRGWSGELGEEDTALLGADDGPGLMQVRSFRSEGRDIEDDDLKELARPHTDAGAQLFRVRYGIFSGFYVHYKHEDTLWYEWWLRSGPMALHVTYHVPEAQRAVEEATVAAILGSLRRVDGGG